LLLLFSVAHSWQWELKLACWMRPWSKQNKFPRTLAHLAGVVWPCIWQYLAVWTGDKYWILEIVGWQYQLVYILYVSFAIFGLVNVFTGVFVDHAMQASSKDREIQIKNQIDEEDFNLKELQKVFQELDGNGSGKLSLEEFEDHLADERASAYFQAVKLDVTEVGRLFRLMDTDNSGSIDIEEFIIGCQRLKGESRSLDIKIALLEIESLQHEMRRLTNHFAERSVTSRGREYVVDSPRWADILWVKLTDWHLIVSTKTVQLHFTKPSYQLAIGLAVCAKGMQGVWV